MNERLQDLLKRMPPIVRNHYFLTAVAFLIWMICFDENNLPLQYTRAIELRDLNRKQTYYHQQTAIVQQQYEELTTIPALQEKYAREHYLMKRPDEEVYVFVKK